MNTRLFILIGSMSLLVLAGCATTPYTNRRQLMMVSESDEDQMGAQAYAEILKKSKLSSDAQATAMLQTVGKRISQAADKPDFHWTFKLIEEAKTVNAFCLPGGRVAFYTGILPITQDELGMAVVMSHEVAHALARHGAERISQQQAAGMVEQAAVASGLIKTEAGLQAFELAYGLGGALPFSRAQESEADRIGLILMAKAGYDPRSAILFWERMAKAKGGQAPPEFLSTHPSDKSRIEKIKEELPEALQYYKP